MKIKITHEYNAIHLRGDLRDTAIVTLSLKGITRHREINEESNLCLTERTGLMRRQIEIEE